MQSTGACKGARNYWFQVEFEMICMLSDTKPLLVEFLSVNRYQFTWENIERMGGLTLLKTDDEIIRSNSGLEFGLGATTPNFGTSTNDKTAEEDQSQMSKTVVT